MESEICIFNVTDKRLIITLLILYYSIYSIFYILRLLIELNLNRILQH